MNLAFVLLEIIAQKYLKLINKLKKILKITVLSNKTNKKTYNFKPSSVGKNLNCNNNIYKQNTIILNLNFLLKTSSLLLFLLFFLYE